MQNNTALQQLLLSRTPTVAQNFDMAGTGQQIYAQAGNTFGGNTALASKAINLATQVGANGKLYSTPQEYMKAVVDAAQQDPDLSGMGPQLQSLAMSMWTNLNIRPNYANNAYAGQQPAPTPTP
jgi:hypothetical protein